MTEDPEQHAAAVRVILGLLRLQTDTPGVISADDLPHMVLMAAEERHRQGDYGAERLLCEWAGLLARPVGEWD